MANPRGEYKAITLRSGKVVEEGTPSKDNHEEVTSKHGNEDEGEIPASPPPKPVLKPYVPKAPYPQRLRKDGKDGQFSKFLEIFKRLQINIPFVEKGELVLRLHEEKMVFNVFKAMSYPKESIGECMLVDTIEQIVQEVMEEEQCGESIKLEQAPDGELPQAAMRNSIMPTTTDNKDAESPKLELKALPPSLRYAYLGANNTHPVIINSSMSKEQEEELIQVLRQHNDAIGWTLADLKGISLSMWVIYPISDSPWVSPMQVVPKKGGITVVANEKNELIPTRTVTGWRMCIDYRKLNEATRKDHFLLPFMDQMLERLAGHEYYCFLDGYSGYNQIVVDPKDQEKTLFTYIVNFKAIGELPTNINKHMRRKLIKDAKHYIWDDPYLFKKCADGVQRRCISHEERQEVLWQCHGSSYGGYFSGERIAAKVLQSEFY
ncbi:uncharacterized protein LOC107491545 [Arachis duranensis]|uniref:Uncharacterized protein LOC107491545 n=1 Tax=Arachis duranensis TaxID=130453 RepID=A0A6P4DQ30_ARADU|nr:uncharacterized protein LOC107491545 [Arachis duranensis]